MEDLAQLKADLELARASRRRTLEALAATSSSRAGSEGITRESLRNIEQTIAKLEAQIDRLEGRRPRLLQVVPR